MSSVPATVGAALDLLGVDRMLLTDVMPRVDAGTVRLRVAPRWFAALWAKAITAVTTPWGVFIHPSAVVRFATDQRDAALGMLMVHELMHVEQLARVGVVAHTLRYVLDYVRGRLRRLGHWEAYRQVRYEVEARAAAALVRSRSQRQAPQ